MIIDKNVNFEISLLLKYLIKDIKIYIKPIPNPNI